jgi:hypothetical protein
VYAVYACTVLLRMTDSLTAATVPARKPWTPSTHVLWPSSSQHSVHMAAVVLWAVKWQHQLMLLPYELVEIILAHVV